MKITVYRNLRFKDVRFSVRHKGKVVETVPEVVLTRCTFKHASSEQIHRCRFGGSAGTGCREVCQWVTGLTTSVTPQMISGWRPLLCDPRKHDGFLDAETNQRIDSASFVHLTSTGSAFYIP